MNFQNVVLTLQELNKAAQTRKEKKAAPKIIFSS